MHSFNKYVIDAEALVKDQTLKGYLTQLGKQAKTDEAFNRYELSTQSNPYEADTQKYKSPKYFGAGGEFLAHNYFDFFGNDYNLVEYESVDDWDDPKKDGGTDGYAKSQKEKSYHKQFTKTKPGSKVFIQVKTTENGGKVFMTNDYSRIPNFCMNAMSSSIVSGGANQDRYLLLHTGLKLHYRLVENSNNLIVEIGRKEIAKKVDHNPFFWNQVRKSFGLQSLDVKTTPNPEYVSVMRQINQEKQRVL